MSEDRLYLPRRETRYGTGRTVTTDGYIRLWRPGHPMATADGYALEHRFVLYEAGVDIPDGAHVHHRNGDKRDNRIKNLEVLAAGDHHRLHGRPRTVRVPWPCATCGETFIRWHRSSRFCSRRCNGLYGSPRAATCARCGDPFAARTATAMYCSGRCCQAAYVERKRVASVA